jgi:hypothetical protein
MVSQENTGLDSLSQVRKDTVGQIDYGLGATKIQEKEAGLSQQSVDGTSPQIGQEIQHDVYVVTGTVDQHGNQNDSGEIGLQDTPKSSEANIIHLEMQGVKFTTLIDTGGSLSLISSTLLKRWDPNFAVSKLESSKIKNIRSASNHDIPLLGRVTVKLKLGEFTIQYPFYVCDQIDIEMVWGVDFLDYAGARIDYSRGELILGPTLHIPLQRIRVGHLGPGPDNRNEGELLQTSQTDPGTTEGQMIKTGRSIDTDKGQCSDDIGVDMIHSSNDPETEIEGVDRVDNRPNTDVGQTWKDNHSLVGEDTDPDTIGRRG